MLVGLVSYFMLVFGDAPVESFYIIDLDKSIKKYVTSITRRQDAEAVVSAYASTFKEFVNDHKKQLKELQQKNIDKNTPETWYQDFFAVVMADRKKLQASFISGRLKLQEIITQEEWDQIIEFTSADVTKLVEKKEKKRKKNEGNHPYNKLSNTIRETITQGEKQNRSLEILDNFHKKFLLVNEAYEKLYKESESEVLVNRQATKEDLQKISNVLNEMRESLMDGYADVIFNLKEITSDREWSIIVKDINNL